jgi:N-methylhydantoinase A
MNGNKFRLGIDIGGTFTDLTLLDKQNGAIVGLKTPTFPTDPAKGIANGLALLQEKGFNPTEIDYFVHGTTIGLNSLLQRKGAPIALFVTEGFRDLLSLQRLRLPIPYNFRSRLPEPLIPRQFVYPIRERMLHDGIVHTPIDLDHIDQAIDNAVAVGLEGIAVCFLHSYKNPEHEQIVLKRIQTRAPNLGVCLSSELWPQMREYERALMTVINLYIQPTVKKYLATLEQNLIEKDVLASPFITQSNGGIMDLNTAAQSPIRTLFSGPAAGVIGARQIAQSAGIDHVVTFDMGGTSADISIIEDGKPTFDQTNHLAGFPIILPSVSIFSVGAGGGSFGWIDKGGLLKVGPESVGSDPGPACYGLGDKATLTDAFLLCGYLNPKRFAAGQVSIDLQKAQFATQAIADHLQMDTRETADHMIQVAVANMYAELSNVMEQYGFDPRDFSLLAFGGAGPVTANFLAEEIQAQSVLIPPNPGTLCALGALHSDFVYDAVQSRQTLLSQLPMPTLEKEFCALAMQAQAWLDQQNVSTLTDHVLLYSLDVRYQGQAFEIELPIQATWLKDMKHDRIIQKFHALHQQQFGHSDPEAFIEVMNLRVRIIGITPKPEQTTLPPAITKVVPVEQRDILYRGHYFRTPVYLRENLLFGHHITGPAIIEQDDTTTLVLAGWKGSVDEKGNLLLQRTNEVK